MAPEGLPRTTRSALDDALAELAAAFPASALLEKAATDSRQDARAEKDTAATTSQGPAATSPKLPPPGTFRADAARLAHLFARPAVPFVTGESARGLPGPGELTAISEVLGLEITPVQRRRGAVRLSDLPCIVATKGGGTRLLVRRAGRGEGRIGLRDLFGGGELVAISADGREYLLSRRMLAREAEGTVFRLRPFRPELAPEPAEARTVGAMVRAGVLRRPGITLALAIAALISNATGLAIPLFSMAVFDRILPNSAFETLWALALGAALCLFIDMGLRHARMILQDAIVTERQNALALRLFTRLVLSPLGMVPNHAGRILPPFAALGAAAQLAPAVAVGLAVDVPFFVAVVALMGALGGPIAFLPAAAALVLYLLHALSRRMMRQRASADQRLAEQQTQGIVETVAMAELLRATAAGPGQVSQFERTTDALTFAGHRLRMARGALAHGGLFLAQAATVAALVLGVYQVDQGLMTAGALSSCVLLMQRAVLPIAGVLTQYFALAEALDAARAIEPTLAAPLEQGGEKTGFRAIDGEISLRGASFHYAGRVQPILTDVSLRIAPGERVGLIGRAGCGKSTLLRVIARLAEPTSGTMLIDDRDARQIDPECLRRAIALMPQDCALLDGSLDMNLVLGLASVDADRFRAITRLTGVAEMADRHPAGFSMAVGPFGRFLSGGERQQVMLARALMGRPRLLLLDEPTAAMDQERERAVLTGIPPLIEGTGLVVATHRLPVLALVDRIIWLDRGRIVADAPKAEIFDKLGLARAA